MTDDEKEKRANDPKVKDLVEWMCESKRDTPERDKSKPYVFISYKSDDWETVLADVVYRLVAEKGLNVYFDGSFDKHSPLWLKQFQKNMSDPKCKGVIAFIDDKYATSYATLLELMYSQAINNKGKFIKKTVVPVNLGALTEIDDKEKEDDTGLGRERYANHKKNVNANREKEEFNKIFEAAVHNEIFDFAVESYYNDNVRGKEGKLTKEFCSNMVETLLGHIEQNDNQYQRGGDLENIYSSIKDAFGEEVFSEPRKPSVTLQPEKTNLNVTIVNGEKKDIIQVKKGERVPKQNAGVRDGFEFKGWFVSNTDEEWDFSNPIHKDMEIYAKWDVAKPELNGGYTYIIFGKKYEAGSREQGKLMFDAFEALVERYPGCADRLTQRTSVSKAEDVKKPNTKEADPAYFRGCKEFEVDGHKYLVGTSYGFQAKLAEIKGMFKICGADLSEFVLNGEPLGPRSEPIPVPVPDPRLQPDGFQYELWGIPYTACKMVDMINGVFELIAQKYPEKVQDLAVSDKITAVVRKSDLDQKTANPSKIKQFTHYKYKEHLVGETVYCVNAGYNREGCIKQIEKMLILCDASPNAFKITKEPEKSIRSGNKGGKQGLGELLI